jgi:hypothetical protein
MAKSPIDLYAPRTINLNSIPQLGPCKVCRVAVWPEPYQTNLPQEWRCCCAVPDPDIPVPPAPAPAPNYDWDD